MLTILKCKELKDTVYKRDYNSDAQEVGIGVEEGRLERILILVRLLHEIVTQEGIPPRPHSLCCIHLPLEQGQGRIRQAQVQLSDKLMIKHITFGHFLLTVVIYSQEVILVLQISFYHHLLLLHH